MALGHLDEPQKAEKYPVGGRYRQVSLYKSIFSFIIMLQATLFMRTLIKILDKIVLAFVAAVTHATCITMTL